MAIRVKEFPYPCSKHIVIIAHLVHGHLLLAGVIQHRDEMFVLWRTTRALLLCFHCFTSEGPRRHCMSNSSSSSGQFCEQTSNVSPPVLPRSRTTAARTRLLISQSLCCAQRCPRSDLQRVTSKSDGGAARRRPLERHGTHSGQRIR